MLLLFGCSSDEGQPANEDDYLIFGHFYGFCAGESCVEVFKLTNIKLYEDTEDNYALEPFNFEEMENEKFNLVKDLMNYFPKELLFETESVLGCPDCSDGGGIFIELSENGKTNSWRIDQFKQNVPEYLHDFMDKVNEKIGFISN